METLYRQFQQAIESAQAAQVAPAIRPHSKLSPGEQLAIYSEGYRLRLGHAIAADYPALKAHLGDRAFNRLAAHYIEAYPSLTCNLDRYPQGFADYAALRMDDAFAVDLARLEQAIAVVFMAPESPALSPQSLISAGPDAFDDMRLVLRRALTLMCCDYPVHDWLDRQRQGQTPVAPEPQRQYLCILRHRNNVQRHLLEAPAFFLLEAIGSGLSVGQALERVAGMDPHYPEALAAGLEAWFAGWLTGGVFTASDVGD